MTTNQATRKGRGAGKACKDAPGMRAAPFIMKTYTMLEEAGNADTVRWGASGTSLVVVKVRTRAGGGNKYRCNSWVRW